MALNRPEQGRYGLTGQAIQWLRELFALKKHPHPTSDIIGYSAGGGLVEHNNDYHNPDYATASDLSTHTGAANPHSGSAATSALEDYTRQQNDGRIVRDSDTQLSWDGYQIGIYNSTAAAWALVKPSSAPTLANTANDLDGNALVHSYNYDIFAEYSSGTAFSLVAKKWTNDTTRAVTPAKWAGRYCYDNSTDAGKKRLWLGTVRLRNDGGVAKFTDSVTQSFVSNYYNEKAKQLTLSVSAGGATFTDTAYVLWTNWTSPGIAFVLCDTRHLRCLGHGLCNTTSDSKQPQTRIYLDGAAVGTGATGSWTANEWARADSFSYYNNGSLAAGYHYLDLYKKLSGATVGTSTAWTGDIEAVILP